MSVLTRVTNFVPGTTIVSSEVDAEFDQIVNTLSGVTNTHEVVVDHNSATVAPITANQENGSGPIYHGQANGTKVFDVLVDGRTRTKTGSADFFTHEGVIDTTVVSAQNVNAAETDLKVKTVLANTINTNGDFVRYTAYLSLTVAIANKVLRVYFGPTKIFDSGTVVTVSSPFAFLEVIGQRANSADDMRFFVRLSFEDSSLNTKHDMTLVTSAGLLTADRDFKVTGQADSSGGITLLQDFMEIGGKR